MENMFDCPICGADFERFYPMGYLVKPNECICTCGTHHDAETGKVIHQGNMCHDNNAREKDNDRATETRQDF